MLGRTKQTPFRDARPRPKQARPDVTRRHRTPCPAPSSSWNRTTVGWRCYLQELSHECRLHGVLNSQMGVMEFEFF